ncbi:MAG: tetratricopeptide repeat protein [Flavobacteriaceae bacterium]|nr:tetratricopeptide repeat protein [Flavobacteriaceae bacterium]
MNTEKDLAKLMEEIKKQDFKSTDELNDFMSNLMGQSLDDLPKSTDKIGRSKDLIYEAYEQSASKAKKLIKQALELDPNNVDAYNYLASIEKDIDKAIKQYEKAIKAGEKTLGKKFFKEEKGYFWGMLETRPYMRAKAGLADCLYAKNEFDKAIGIYTEMLDLNPNDNQGVRYLLSTLYLRTNNFKKFNDLNKKYDEYGNAVSNFNIALSQFKQEKQSEISNKLLTEAHNENNFVIDLLLGNKKMPKKQPDYIGIGDKNEAVAYVYGNYQLWEETQGAFEWIYDYKQKRLKMN